MNYINLKFFQLLYFFFAYTVIKIFWDSPGFFVVELRDCLTLSKQPVGRTGIVNRYLSEYINYSVRMSSKNHKYKSCHDMTSG